jgi:hypothetical protein
MQTLDLTYQPLQVLVPRLRTYCRLLFPNRDLIHRHFRVGGVSAQNAKRIGSPPAISIGSNQMDGGHLMALEPGRKNLLRIRPPWSYELSSS